MGCPYILLDPSSYMRKNTEQQRWEIQNGTKRSRFALSRKVRLAKVKEASTHTHKAEDTTMALTPHRRQQPPVLALPVQCRHSRQRLRPTPARLAPRILVSRPH